MSALDLSTARWRKSTRSTNTSNCVEVAFPGAVAAVRDSKNPAGPALLMPAASVTALLTTVRAESI
ncbi:DUF397 domain-containing protein [Actinokineospora sp.]|uniref:DUF397 domain-containing protein n=1 Tax=Actinokineospora sp. TaxID=1872133 RepID=UPI00403778E9